jgi:hypothetical protein
MPLAPIIELRSWYESHDLKHKNLAKLLNLSPQQLSELFSGRNNPTGLQLLAILEFLRTNNMTTVDEPKTLGSAKDLIQSLREELNELKGGKATLPIGSTQIPPAVTVTPPIAPKQPTPLPVASTPPAAINDRGTGMIFHPGPPLTELSPIDRLRVELNNTKDAAKRAALYRQIKTLSRGPKLTNDQAP